MPFKDDVLTSGPKSLIFSDLDEERWAKNHSVYLI